MLIRTVVEKWAIALKTQDLEYSPDPKNTEDTFGGVLKLYGYYDVCAHKRGKFFDWLKSKLT